MNPSREILTLQFGHYSNYVGTHLWNIQERGFEYQQADSVSEVNNDVLFREGVNLQGKVTFTPRLLLVDVKGSLKTLPEQGELYSTNNPSSSANLHQYEVIQEPPENAIAFQKHLTKSELSDANYNLDEEVRTWSDFLYSRFHPRTVNIIKNYGIDEGSSQLGIFPQGRLLWNCNDFQDDFIDKIRNYVEECDNLQGFHILLDGNNGFSGLSSSCIEYLADEYSRKAIFAFPVLPPMASLDSFEDDSAKYKAMLGGYISALNYALCVDSLVENSTIFTPLSVGNEGFKYFKENQQFNHIYYKPQLPYHSSAILASAIDTFSLRYRLNSSSYTLWDLGADLSMHGRKLSAASLCLPFSLNKDQDFLDCLDNWQGPLTRSITPNCEIGEDSVAQLYTLRGIPDWRLKKLKDKTQQLLPAYKCKTLKDMLEYYVSCTAHACPTSVTIVNKSLPVKTPYPKMFDSKLEMNGDYNPHIKTNVDKENVPVLAGLHNGEFIGGMLDHFIKEIKTINFNRFTQFHEQGFDNDEHSECLNRLMNFKECYENNYFI